MLEHIGSSVLSVLGGGLLGALPNLANMIYQYKLKQLDVSEAEKTRAHEVAMRKVDSELAKSEAAAALEISRTKADAEVEIAAIGAEVAEESGRTARYVADSAVFGTAVQSLSQRYSGVVSPTTGQGWALIAIDAVRAAIQPLTTIYLVVLTSILCFTIRRLMGSQTLMPDQVFRLIEATYNTVLTMTSIALSFWYGQRFTADTVKR